MIKRLILLAIASAGALLIFLPSAAQSTGPAVVPFAQLTPAPTVQPAADDGRLAQCSAPTRADFRPYLVRPGDALIDLLIGHSAFSPAQIAALNCLPDPDALPVGAVIWLPQDALAVTDAAVVMAESTAEPHRGEPEIRTFTPPPPQVINDQPFTVTWDAVGDQAAVYLCVLDQADPADCRPPDLSARLPVSGSLTIGPFAAPGLYQLVLEVRDRQGRTTSAAQPFIVTCAHPSLAGEAAARRCPDEPARTVFAAYQPFERGLMLYFSDSGQIYALTDDHRFTVFTDVYVEGMPDPTDPAPSGRITPVRGFGQIWRTLGGPEAAIGFGLTYEQGYDAQRQPAARGSFTTYVTTPDGVLALTSIPGQPGGWWARVR
jgi:hypothetical protein